MLNTHFIPEHEMFQILKHVSSTEIFGHFIFVQVFIFTFEVNIRSQAVAEISYVHCFPW